MAVFNESPKDAKGRLLQEGDEILLNIRSPLLFRIAQIVPVLDPNAPRGLYQIHVGALMTFTAKGGVVHHEFLRVATVDEVGPGNFKLLDARPSEGAPES